ncbi:MAG TPA: hypothetical protein VF600_07700 [Abditibacteriaceae bacterium]|jgi:hypothetical protein
MKCWNVKELLVDGGEYDRNGGAGVWTDYAWDGNVIRNAGFHDKFRPGIAVEMTVGMEITGCTLSRNDTDGIAGIIPAAFRPWDKSLKSGPDLWTGEFFLFNASGAGTYTDPATQLSYSFAGRTRVHSNRIRDGNGGILTLYQDRAAISPLKAQMAGTRNGPVAGIDGIVVEDNSIACKTDYAAAVNTLVGRDYKDADGTWGQIPPAQTQYQAVTYRRNIYSGNFKFCVPKAATLGGSTNVCDWNDRADVDLPEWQALGKH